MGISLTQAFPIVGGSTTGGGGGGTVTGTGTATQVAFWSAATVISSDSNLYWDNAAKRLGIGTSSPVTSLHIASTDDAEFIRLGSTGDSVGIYSGDNDPNITPVIAQAGSLFLRTNGSTWVNTDGISAWTDLAGGATASGWTDDGVVVRLTTSTDNVGIGIALPTGKLHVFGDTDEIQLRVTGNATQTSDILRIENSALTALVTVDNTGNLRPGTNNTQDFGSNTLRWMDVFVGPASVHVGTSELDEGTISYNTVGNIFNFGTDSTTNGDIAFFTDDLYLDKSTARIGIGTTVPAARLTVVETSSILIGTAAMTAFVFTADPTANSIAGFSSGNFSAESDTTNVFNIGSLSGLRSNVIHRGTGTVATGRGLAGLIFNEDVGTITTAQGVAASINNLSTGIITTSQGLFVAAPFNGAGTITDSYGVYVETSAAATNNYAAYFGDFVGINELAPAKALHITGLSNDEFIRLGITGDTAGIFAGSADPNVTPVTGQRGSLFLRTNGSVYVNTDDATTWAILSSGGLSGAGVAGQVTFWTGVSSLSGDNDLWWDNVNKYLGINTIVPVEDLDVEGNSVLAGHVNIGANLALTATNPDRVIDINEDFAAGGNKITLISNSSFDPAAGTDTYNGSIFNVTIADGNASSYNIIKLHESFSIDNNSNGGNQLIGHDVLQQRNGLSVVGEMTAFRAEQSFVFGSDVTQMYGFQYVQPNIPSGSTSTTYAFFSGDMSDTFGTPYAFFYGDVAQTSATVINAAGHIGIRTATPTAHLHIDNFDGDDIITQRLQWPSADIGIYGGVTNPNGSLNVTGFSGLGSLYFNAAIQALHINLDGASAWGAIRGEVGATIASAGDLTLVDNAKTFIVTGSTQINAIMTANRDFGAEICLIFTGAPLVKHNTAGGAGTARMFLAGSVDFAAAANSVIGFNFDGTQWQETFRKVA